MVDFLRENSSFFILKIIVGRFARNLTKGDFWGDFQTLCFFDLL